MGALAALLCSCAPADVKEADSIIDFDESRFARWNSDAIFAHFDKLWSIRIQDAPGPPWARAREFFIPNARAVLHDIVDRCDLGETIFQHQNHGLASLVIDDTDLSAEKVRCIRQFERHGISLEMGGNMQVLEDLRSKGILPTDESGSVVD